jgi:hypothetical protein
LCKGFDQLYEFTNFNRTCQKVQRKEIITGIRCQTHLPRTGLHLVIFKVDKFTESDVQLGIVVHHYSWAGWMREGSNSWYVDHASIQTGDLIKMWVDMDKRLVRFDRERNGESTMLHCIHNLVQFYPSNEPQQEFKYEREISPDDMYVALAVRGVGSTFTLKRR